MIIAVFLIAFALGTLFAAVVLNRSEAAAPQRKPVITPYTGPTFGRLERLGE